MQNHKTGDPKSIVSPKGPSTPHLGIWGLGNSNYSTSFGEVYDY